MLKVRTSDVLFRRFIRVNLLRYLIPNTLLNGILPYLTLRSLDAVYLFQGKNCFARFLLPMALLLPFIITYDILKRTTVFTQQNETGFTLPEHVSKNTFMFKMAGINGGITVLVFLVVLLLIQLNIPQHYGFNGTILSVFLGVVAGILSVIFTLLPVKKILALDVV